MRIRIGIEIGFVWGSSAIMVAQTLVLASTGAIFQQSLNKIGCLIVLQNLYLQGIPARATRVRFPEMNRTSNRCDKNVHHSSIRISCSLCLMEK